MTNHEEDNLSYYHPDAIKAIILEKYPRTGSNYFDQLKYLATFRGDTRPPADMPSVLFANLAKSYPIENINNWWPQPYYGNSKLVVSSSLCPEIADFYGAHARSREENLHYVYLIASREVLNITRAAGQEPHCSYVKNELGHFCAIWVLAAEYQFQRKPNLVTKKISWNPELLNLFNLDEPKHYAQATQALERMGIIYDHVTFSRFFHGRFKRMHAIFDRSPPAPNYIVTGISEKEHWYYYGFDALRYRLSEDKHVQKYTPRYGVRISPNNEPDHPSHEVLDLFINNALRKKFPDVYQDNPQPQAQHIDTNQVDRLVKLREELQSVIASYKDWFYRSKLALWFSFRHPHGRRGLQRMLQFEQAVNKACDVETLFSLMQELVHSQEGRWSSHSVKPLIYAVITKNKFELDSQRECLDRLKQ